MLTTKEAALVIGCDESHVRRMIRGGRLAATAHRLPNGSVMYTIHPATARSASRRRKAERRGRPRKES